MTLIEIGIALAIVAGLMAIAVPALSSVARVQLRQKSGQLAAGIRAMRGSAALSGHSCRMVFDLDANAYWSECAKTTVRLAGGGERAHDGARETTRDEELLAAADAEHLSDEDRARLELARKAAFQPSSDIPRTELGASVRFVDVWVQHQPERYTSGKAFLYFWPSGLTENAAVHVAQGDDVNTLLVSPLTGRVKVASGRIEPEGAKR
jgi:general secretion pathway protein H